MSRLDESLLYILEITDSPQSTWNLSLKSNEPTNLCLISMKRLEAKGLVAKHKRYSKKNNYVWELLK